VFGVISTRGCWRLSDPKSVQIIHLVASVQDSELHWSAPGSWPICICK